MISQSEHAFNVIHCFSIHFKYLTFKAGYETPKGTEPNKIQTNKATKPCKVTEQFS